MKSLRIERLVASDDGVYVCEGKNDVGSVEAAARLTIHSQPSFSVTPTDQTVGAHRSVTLKVREMREEMGKGGGWVGGRIHR